MLRAIIIDDEKNTRDVVSAIMAKHCKEVEIIGFADSVKSGVQIIQKHKPDLLLLDIHLPDGTGFDILKGIKPDNFKIIFITAHEEYALKAFKFSALDYILKPINSNELTASIKKATDSLQHAVNLQLATFAHNYSNLPKEPKKIILKTLDSIYSVSVTEIIRCQADTCYTRFFLRDGQIIMVSATLKKFDELLTEFGFFRVHQSHLINLDYFVRYKKTGGGLAILNDGTEVPVASRKKDLFLRAVAGL